MTGLYNEPGARHDRWCFGCCSLPDPAQQVGYPLAVLRQPVHADHVPWWSGRLDEPQDAEKIGVKDGEWVECVNTNGVFVGRAVVSHRIPEGISFVYHAQERMVSRSLKSPASAVVFTTR